MKLKIAIQGIESSFHDLAVQQLFPDRNVELVPCMSFESVTENLANKNADLGVIAIENTIAGSILPNYNLIDNGNFKILDETFLTIDMYLMALEGDTIHDINEVHSHPVALQQCAHYLQRLQPHCKVIEGKDTASEAKKIKDGNLHGVAAIAGKQVAKKYGLKILDKKIQTIKENKTRFVVIGRQDAEDKVELNKASIKFVLGHEVGSLAKVLKVMGDHNINLTKIQSFPIEGKPWKYSFFVDVLFEDYKVFTEVIGLLEEVTNELKVLGAYKQNLENTPSRLNKVSIHGE